MSERNLRSFPWKVASLSWMLKEDKKHLTNDVRSLGQRFITGGFMTEGICSFIGMACVEKGVVVGIPSKWREQTIVNLDGRVEPRPKGKFL